VVAFRGDDEVVELGAELETGLFPGVEVGTRIDRAADALLSAL
jgi:hypothetical protein